MPHPSEQAHGAERPKQLGSTLDSSHLGCEQAKHMDTAPSSVLAGGSGP
jgi:hypothetical protein